jgi:transposase
MGQIHKKFTTEQVKVLLAAYEGRHISREEIQRTLGVQKTRFFALLKKYREGESEFTLDYHRAAKGRLAEETEEKIREMLLEEKGLVEDKELPIKNYNYAAVADRLKKVGVEVSTTTIIKRAKQQGCYLPRKKKKDRHDREIITSAVGDLIQHDASLHKWSPYASEKWTLITSLDDHSRMIMYADFVETKTNRAHIQFAQFLMQHFSIPHRYYVDNLCVFRFIQHRDSVWKNLVLGTDDVVYAMSPQAKGKIERPYRWLQDRIVRTCALNKITTLADTGNVLLEEVHRYNYHQVHSTTQEIPALRFEKARQENRSLFRSFTLPKPFSSTKDVFCIHHDRVADGYRRISIAGISLQIQKIDPRQDVELHFVPDQSNNQVEIRVWASNLLVYTTFLPFDTVSKLVHF